MIRCNLLLNSIDDVKQFVHYTNSHDYSIDLLSGKYMVNAKSIMGIFSLDLTKPVTMVAHCDPGDSISQEVAPYLFVEETK